MGLIKADSIIFLIGAGCSMDAQIKTSGQMIHEIEELIKTNPEWMPFRNLYFYVKSAILYADGIQGMFDNNINIERLVGVLRDLKKKERNPIYPFIGSWNEKLIELAGEGFSNIDKFDKLLSKKIVDFVTLHNNTMARVAYYKKFYDFQKSIQAPIRVFSLNYDQCLEKAKLSDYDLECGFDENSKWSSERFSNTSDISAGIYLYKLHGSIDWVRDSATGILMRYDSPQENAELIFGTDAKLQSVDPFLFNVYELRYYSLLCKLIVIIGYSFNDSHINGLLGQALRSSNRKLLVVDTSDDYTILILEKLSLDSSYQSQVVYKKLTAKEFLESELTKEKVENLIPDDDEVFQ
ncbi:SIR2 family protein [Syntrophomonas wolfei]|uniref:SIR2 family protein n=1 Tax=Syntrophomonas wolfei TaxID=863 RepID=UPI0007746470|nr:SIR2 family protein [Syntrophomonas wolfei]